MGFDFPAIFSFPPFFTKQRNLESGKATTLLAVLVLLTSTLSRKAAERGLGEGHLWLGRAQQSNDSKKTTVWFLCAFFFFFLAK
jgi:hypothetical protein